jgi:predicted phage baseplate assembly protein
VDLDAAKRATIRRIRSIHRAVTPQDFEELALQADFAPSQEQVRRAKCIPQVNLEIENAADQATEAPGHFSIVVVSNRRFHATQELLANVHRHLEPARLLTTRIHVVRPKYVTFSIRMALVPRHSWIAETLRDEAIAALEGFFDPLTGGFDKNGWPFGRNIYVSEVYQVLNGLAGVDYVTRVRDPKSGEEMDELVMAPSETARARRNELGELEAVELRANELVALWIDTADITIASI